MRQAGREGGREGGREEVARMVERGEKGKPCFVWREGGREGEEAS